MSHMKICHLIPLLLFLLATEGTSGGDLNLPWYSDFDGNGKTDILWRNQTDGQLALWTMDGGSRTANISLNTVSNLDWQIVSSGDYNGDMDADILWRNTSTGQVVLWLMIDGNMTANLVVDTVSDLRWQIIDTADFDGDDKTDILWRHSVTGQLVLWPMDGGTRTANLYIDTVSNPNWKVIAAGDYDGNDTSDILWRHQSSGQLALWLMNGATRTANLFVDTVSDLHWQIVGHGDYNGDNKADMFWRHNVTGQNAMWLMDGATRIANLGVTTVSDLDWKVDQDGDYDGDNNSDVLWRRSSNGQIAIWLMNSATISSSTFLNPAVSMAWEVMVGELRGSSGLQQRPINLSCTAPEQPTVNTSVSTTQVFGGVGTFNQPLALTQAPADSSEWYVVERGGTIYRFDNDPSASSKTIFIDITARADSSYGEGGLLGIAFHPNYDTNRIVYLSYTATGPQTGGFVLTSRLSRFESFDNGLTLDPSTEVILLSYDQPFGNHNGGNIAFGPDGYLYLGLGDGGSGGDPGNRAQNTKNLFGTIARIDVDSSPPYGIPISNPFEGNSLCNVGTTGIDAADSCPEIYAWGLRNPWRWTFDSLTGVLWLSDVGQDLYEEVNTIELGGNYGWRIQEGFACFNPSSGCNTSGLIQPIITYGRAVGQSITGGYVYRGTDIPEIYGQYVFADFAHGKIFATTPQTGGGFDYELLIDTSFTIPSFAEDQNSEQYFLHYGGGTIHKLIQFGGTSNDTIPAVLSGAGCNNSIELSYPNSSVIPYETIESFWSDGAAKERFYAIPDGSTVDIDISGDWQFPIGTVLVKNFRINGQLIETRHLMRHTNGDWAGYTYEWNDDQSEALRVVGGKTKDVGGQSWIFPSETECMTCHTAIAGYTLGIENAQLNKDKLYPTTGITANQLRTADEAEILTNVLPDIPENLPVIKSLNNPPVEEQIRSYLHVNCSGCHRPLGPTQSNMDLRFDTAWAAMNVCDVNPSLGTLGIANARLIAPGDSSRSILVNRMNRRDAHGMPPLGSNIVDSDGVNLISDWIDGLTVCP